MGQVVQILQAVGGALPWLAGLGLLGAFFLAWLALRGGCPFSLTLLPPRLDVRRPPKGGKGG